MAIELLLFEFRSRSFIPLVIARMLATSTRSLLPGQRSMFSMGNVDFDVLHGLPYYLLLGFLCGRAPIGFSRLLYWVEDQFDRLPIGDLWHAAIGALGLGTIGFFVPRVLGVGYDAISDILNNNLAPKTHLLLTVFKALALVISLGSGTSGGLLAPMVMSSAVLGGTFAVIINRLAPGAHLSPGAYALVAMGAVFGAASRATFAFILFAFEIGRDYNSVLPLMLVCVIADMIATRYQSSSIMTEKLVRHGLSIPEEYEAGVLKAVRVGEVMRKDVPTVPPDMTVRELAERMGRGDPGFNLTQGLRIVSGERRLLGVATQGDLPRALQEDPSGKRAALDAGGQSPLVAYPDERVFDALFRMLQNNIRRLPVVSREDPQRMVGYLNRSSILNAWTRQLEEEHVRERGWLDQFLHTDEFSRACEKRTLVGRVVKIGGDLLEPASAGEGSARNMEFRLKRPLTGIALGDQVRIGYRVEDGSNVLQSIQELRLH